MNTSWFLLGKSFCRAGTHTFKKESEPFSKIYTPFTTENVENWFYKMSMTFSNEY